MVDIFNRDFIGCEDFIFKPKFSDRYSDDLVWSNDYLIQTFRPIKFIHFDFKQIITFLSNNSKTVSIFSQLSSALSSRNLSLCSARLVNILYGSVTPCVTRSSIITPIYELSLVGHHKSLSLQYKDAFMPAIIPCAAASSYPVVPLI